MSVFFRFSMKWLFSIVFALGLAEGLLRLVPDEPRLAAHVAYDPLLGHKGPPLASVQTPSSLLQYSEEGFRALPLSLESARRRVVILGDSFTEAFTFPDEQIYPYLLAQDLRLHGQPVALKVFAVGDWGTTQQLLAYREFAEKFDPDLVILQFTALNDFLNNSVESAGHYQSRLDGVRPYRNERGEIVYLHPLRKWLQDHTRLGRWLGNLWLSFSMRQVLPVDPDCHRNPHLRPIEVYRTVVDENWQRMMRDTVEIVKQLKQEVGRRAGRKLVAVYFPNPLELLSKQYADVVEGPLALCFGGLPRPSPREAERKFFAVFQAAGVEAVSLLDGFERAVKAGKYPFIYDGHLNPFGHELAASLLKEKLFGGEAKTRSSSLPKRVSGKGGG